LVDLLASAEPVASADPVASDGPALDGRLATWSNAEPGSRATQLARGTTPDRAEQGQKNEDTGKAQSMSVLKRLSGIIQAKANRALDKAENPADMLDLSYEKQVENLQKVRRALADVATARKRLELQATQLQAQADKLQTQARQALAQNREDLAREALARRATLGEQLQQLGAQHEQVETQQQQLETTAQRLQTQIEAFRTRKETLKATYQASKAQADIGAAVSGISESMTDAGMTLQRAEEKINQMQARAGAIDELLETGALPDMLGTGGGDDIQRELDRTAASGQVDAELAAMKAELAGSGGGVGALPPPAAADAGTSTPATGAPAEPDARGGQDQGDEVR